MKVITIGVIVSATIDVQVLVPDNLKLNELQKWMIKEKVSTGEFKCLNPEVEEDIKDLFSNYEVSPQSLFNYEYELNACNLQVKKINYVMDEVSTKLL